MLIHNYNNYIAATEWAKQLLEKLLVNHLMNKLN